MQYEPTRAIKNTMLLFSTPVFAYDEYSDITYTHETFKEQENVIKNRGGNFSSKETNILELDSYKLIKDRIMDGLTEYVNDVLFVDKRHEFYITQSWANMTEPNEFHHKHLHPNSIVSGVMYLETNDDDKIQFLADTEIYKKITLDSKSFNDFNINHAIIGTGYKKDLENPIQICSALSLFNKALSKLFKLFLLLELEAFANPPSSPRTSETRR